MTNEINTKTKMIHNKLENYTAEQWWNDRDEAEKNRIMKWKQKEAKQLPDISYRATKEDNVVRLAINFDSPNLSDHQKSEIQKSSLCAATGSASEDYGRLLMSQAIGALVPSGYDHAMMSNAVNHALLALAPDDEYEGMLISRMIVLHNQYMYYMTKAGNANTTDIIDSNINRATKLMRVYNETLETLNKYRRKGQQMVTVQHVNVNGGQTVVAGNFNNGGGGNDKK